MLRMANIQKKFQTGDVVTYALRDFNLEVEEGDFVAIQGRSGAGKTTFLNIAGLLDQADSGQYWIAGRDASDLSDAQRSVLRGMLIGLVFQGFNLLPDLSAIRNVELPLRIRGMPKRERKQRAIEMLERVGLVNRMNHLPSKMSGGQQQRVAIARALAGSPDLILADEPTGNLDVSTANQIMELLLEINGGGRTVVMVTHSPAFAQMAKRRLTVLDGQIVA